MFKIGNIKFKNNVVLAPMAGTSNAAFMKICEEFDLGYAVTELISSEAIIRGNKKTFEMLNGLEKLNIPVAIQIFGANASVMAEAARIINEKYPAAIIDINMGCPVPKVAQRANAGAALLNDPGKVYEIVRSVKNAVDVPVTVKMRSGWDKKSINAVLIAKKCEEAGADAITIHPRTRSEGYTGKADWSIIKKVKESVHIPVIGNGDVTSAELAKKMLDETGCDAVMIGRAVLGNPYLIKQVVTYINDGILIEDQSNTDKINTCIKHFNNLLENKSEKTALLQIRTHAAWYLKGLPNALEVKRQIYGLKSKNDFMNLLDNYKKTLKNKEK